MAVLLLSKTDAQLFHKKDSIRQMPVLQFGLGGYFGSHYLISNSSGIELQNTGGYDQGLLAKIALNLTSTLTSSVDFRYYGRSAVINFNANVSPHFFVVKATGIQLPIFLTYTISNNNKIEILSISVGAAYNKINYEISYDELTDWRYLTASPLRQVTDIKTEEKFSCILGISKKNQIKQTKLHKFIRGT